MAAQQPTFQVFLSYRRDDAPSAAGRLRDALALRFGEDSIFLDVDTLEPGIDFKEAIDRAVGTSDVLIAMIGKDWLAVGDDGRRRIDSPDDYVRLEIEAALMRDIRVIPALVENVAMPQSDELPASIAQLARRNAVELGEGARWRADVERLIDALARQRSAKEAEAGASAAAAKPVEEPRQEGTERPPRRPRRALLLAGLAAFLLAAGGIAGGLVATSGGGGSGSGMDMDGGGNDAILEQLVLGHIPASIRSSCSKVAALSTAFQRTVRCVQGGGTAAAVVYARGHSTDALRAYFDGRAQFVGAASSSGAGCARGRFPAMTPWHRRGQQTHVEGIDAGVHSEGRVLCYSAGGRTWIVWTDTPTKLLGQASRPTGQWPALYAWWRTQAGPEKERASMKMDVIGPYPDSIEKEDILDHLPTAIRDHCRRSDPSSYDREAFLRAVDCTDPSGQRAQYAIAHSGSALRQHSDHQADNVGLQFDPGRSDGSCAGGSGATGYWQRVNDIGHRETSQVRRADGRVLCYTGDGNATIEWTDISTSIYGSASRPAEKRRALYQWWQRQAGPGPLEGMAGMDEGG